MTLQVPSTHRTTLGGRTFPVAAVRAWNSLPPETRAWSSLMTLQRETKSHLFRQYNTTQRVNVNFRPSYSTLSRRSYDLM